MGKGTGTGRPFKLQVAESFSRAAPGYDQAAHFQRYVASTLRTQCGWPVSRGHLIDVGCGTGNEWQALAEAFQVESITGLDLAEGMVRFAMHRAAGNPVRHAGIVGDAEQLPFSESAFDVFHSSLAVQWCEDFGAMLRECYRCLRPGGVAMFSTLLKGTLAEMESAWRDVDGWQHVNAFLSMEDIEKQLAATPWSRAGCEVHLKAETVVLEYRSVKALTSELKALGAHNVTPGRKRSVMSRAAVRDFIRAYEAFRMENGMLPATYQVLYCYLKKDCPEALDGRD